MTVGRDYSHINWKVEKPKMGLARKLFFSGIALATILAGLSQVPRALKWLPESAFQNAPILKYYNSDGNVWNEYMGENIPHNQMNWAGYVDKAKELNPEGLLGTIYLPDMDGNGKIGK
jgi:hypothetical protein